MIFEDLSDVARSTPPRAPHSRKIAAMPEGVSNMPSNSAVLGAPKVSVPTATT